MNLVDLFLALLVAVVCGTIAQLTSGYSHGGWIVNLGFGFIGALAGVIVSRSLNAPLLYDLKFGTVIFPIVYSIVGSVFLLAGIGLLIKPKRN